MAKKPASDVNLIPTPLWRQSGGCIAQVFETVSIADLPKTDVFLH
jgi:hypothetical protein